MIAGHSGNQAPLDEYLIANLSDMRVPLDASLGIRGTPSTTASICDGRAKVKQKHLRNSSSDLPPNFCF